MNSKDFLKHFQSIEKTFGEEKPTKKKLDAVIKKIDDIERNWESSKNDNELLSKLAWIKLYKVKTFFQLGRKDEAWNCLDNQVLKNVADLKLPKMDLIEFLEGIVQIVGESKDVTKLSDFGKRCIQLCLASPDPLPENAYKFAHHICLIFDKLEKSDMNGYFAVFIAERGRETKNSDTLVEGWEFIMNNIDSDGPSGECKIYAANHYHELYSLSRKDAFEMAQYVAQAKWLTEVMGPDRAKKLALTRTLWSKLIEGNLQAVKSTFETSGLISDVNYRNIENPGLPTALIVATRKNHVEIVKYLLAKGASTEQTNLQNFTALGIAADNGYLQVVHLLLMHGANVNHKNSEGQSPLHMAAYQGYKEVTKLLLSHKGIQLELKDAAGCTPLTVACISDAPDVVTLLIESGANIEARQDKTLATPLIAAAMNGVDTTVRVLVDHGADTLAKDANNLTANDWAQKKGHQHISELLTRVKKQKT